MTGTIKKKTDKGFGFIEIEGKDKDLFFHSNDLIDVTFDQLHGGDEVSFEITQGNKGPRAENIKRV